MSRCILAASTIAFTAAITVAFPVIAAVGVSQVASGLTNSVFLTSRGNELIVAQQDGTIVAINRSTRVKRSFFTVSGIEVGGEKGLLGMTFDPSYGHNGRFYVDVTTRTSGQLVTQIRRYTNPAIAIEASTLIAQINQPYDNHNGGWIDFGPEKKLYIAMGDGGSANDPMNNAQNLNVDLGKILRIDVNKDGFPSDPTRNYAIPAGNPFGTEVFAYGLRNPFRDSFDAKTGNLFIGDVGQAAREEVDVIPLGTSGQNFGWRAVEGNIPTPGIGDPVPANAVAPLLTYDHSVGHSVTGGYVFRGSSIAELSGKYVFGDFVKGKIFTAGTDGSGFTDISTTLGELAINPSSFGQDGNRNLYVVDYNGNIYKFVETAGATLRANASSSAGTANGAVPEPATWTLLIAGFGMVGITTRRRTRKMAQVRGA